MPWIQFQPYPPFSLLPFWESRVSYVLSQQKWPTTNFRSTSSCRLLNAYFFPLSPWRTGKMRKGGRELERHYALQWYSVFTHKPMLSDVVTPFYLLPWSHSSNVPNSYETTGGNRWSPVDRLGTSWLVNWALKFFHPTLGSLLYGLPNFKAIITSFTQMPDKTDKKLIGMITNTFLLNKLKQTGRG